MARLLRLRYPANAVNAELSLLEKVLYAHIESYEGQSGAGTPVDRDDPVMDRIADGQWFRRVELADIPASSALAEARAELAEELGEEPEELAFAVEDPATGPLGWLLLLWTEGGDCGYVLVSTGGEIELAQTDVPHLFFEDGLLES